MNTANTNVMVGNLVPAIKRITTRDRKAIPATGARNVALAIAAPLIGLVFVVAFPLVGLAILAWAGALALARRAKPIARFAKNVALFVAAPFVGLAYALAFPFIGMGILAWRGARTLVKRRAAL